MTRLDDSKDRQNPKDKDEDSQASWDATPRSRPPQSPLPRPLSQSQWTLRPPKLPFLNAVPRISSSSSPAAISAPTVRDILRQKVVLKPNHSPLDWAKINRKEAKNVLRGVGDNFPPPQCVKISKAELQKHTSKRDCWTCINGKVFNITPYLNYHPGGVDEIMKCAGRDGTSLFNKYHRWVNDSGAASTTDTIEQHHRTILSNNTIEQYCRTTPSNNTVEQHYRTTPSNNTVEQHYRTTPSNNTVEQHYRTTPSNNTVEQHYRTTPSNNTVEQHYRTTPSNNTIEQHHRTTPSNNTIEQHYLASLDSAVTG
ncbi:hypothetical protein KGF56_001729 [Candida oxycetoniae]|uniref:Cytochrome b5 heme-binding domain-containing protein n=1 Tax=Candida oxycetoniae TaxID=497107 RepID=A0AAI9SZB5_9ASCO|nr:uncharacterized protein KGF56_001729 [Candida oxycetoniae]KAI3405459.2 hypothetical protein KGF56_001729 [Candida oxycetoniae]